MKEALKALKKLRQNNIDDSHLFDDELLDIIEKTLKAFEIVQETPEFVWYVKIYKDAYEMITDRSGFRVNESVEELQKKFDLLREVLK